MTRIPIRALDCDLEDALTAVERAQTFHGRVVTSAEVVEFASPRESLPSTPTGMARVLRSFSYRPGVGGRTLRRLKRDGHAAWQVYLNEDCLHWASEATLRAQLSAIANELARRAREERPEPPAPKPLVNPFAKPEQPPPSSFPSLQSFLANGGNRSAAE